MALRFLSRHVHASLFDYLKTNLVTLGWADVTAVSGGATVNFHATTCTYLDSQPDLAGRPINPNTIAITLGDEPGGEDMEMGAGLVGGNQYLVLPLFVDVYGDSQAVTASILADVRSLVGDVALTVYDHSVSPSTATTVILEMLKGDVRIGTPTGAGAGDVHRFWRVLRTNATVYYSV